MQDTLVAMGYIYGMQCSTEEKLGTQQHQEDLG